MELTKGEEVVLEEDPIVIGVPKETVKLTVTADIYHDGEIRTATKHYTMRDIQDNREDFRRFIGDDWDALYVLTEEAKKEPGII